MGVIVCFGSYRTYEEWKPYWSDLATASNITVLTVPMRNGNNGGVGYEQV